MKLHNVIVALAMLIVGATVFAPVQASAHGLSLGDYSGALQTPTSAAIGPPAGELLLEPIEAERRPFWLQQYRTSMSAGTVGRIVGFIGITTLTVTVVTTSSCLGYECSPNGTGVFIGGMLTAFGVDSWGALSR